MGHIFQLGRKYAEALGLKVLDQNGKLVTVTMGSYGVGISRAVAAVAEGTCDEKGLCWPRELAPFDVHIVAAGKDEVVITAAADLAVQLDEAGVSVLLDDRSVSPGVKFADSEIMGMPTIVVVGRGLSNGVIEVRDRRSGEQVEVAVEDALDRDPCGGAWPTWLGLGPRLLDLSDSVAGGADRRCLRRGMGRCGRRRRWADPVAGTADRAAQQYATGSDLGHEQDLLVLRDGDQLADVRAQDPARLADRGASGRRLSRRIGSWGIAGEAVAEGRLHSDCAGRADRGGHLHLAPAAAGHGLDAEACGAKTLRAGLR